MPEKVVVTVPGYLQLCVSSPGTDQHVSLESCFCKLSRVKTPGSLLLPVELTQASGNPVISHRHCLQLMHLHQTAALLGPPSPEGTARQGQRSRRISASCLGLGAARLSLEHLDPRCAAEVTLEKAGRL